MPISIKTPVYEGPLDLLLELIEKRKLLINDIALATVTEEYIARINSMESLPVGETAEFVALAATLLLIKSRSLLPLLTLSDEESRDIKELKYRLALFQIIKSAGCELARVLEQNNYLYEGVAEEIQPMFIPDLSVTLSSLHAAAQALMAGFPQYLTLPTVQVKTIVSIEEMIERLQERVTSALRLSFKEFARSTGSGQAGKLERGEIIISFLALLELVKQGIIKATQEGGCGDILLESDSVATPSYE